MKSFLEEVFVQEKINELIELHRDFVIGTMVPDVDPQVSAQKSRMFKFWCWIKYGHLLDKKGICMRCGKVLTIPNGK